MLTAVKFGGLVDVLTHQLAVSVCFPLTKKFKQLCLKQAE